MSGFAPRQLRAFEASEPPEARGLRRDEVRLMVASRSSGEIVHARFCDLPQHLRPGDLLVVNTSGTLPAAVCGRAGDGTWIEVRFATPAPPPADASFGEAGGPAAVVGSDRLCRRCRDAIGSGVAPASAGATV
jgi:hypothetical protein